MSFCPKCKAEYINGRADCADCGVPLVEKLEDILDETASGYDISGESETVDDSDSDSVDDTYNSMGVDDTDDDDTDDPGTDKPKYQRSYVSKSDRAKDHLSTGYTFLFVGIAGIVVITLNLLGIINIFRTYGASSVLFYGVMYAMFVIFLFVAFNAFKNAGKIKADVQEEITLIDNIKSYINQNITKDMLEECVSKDSDGSEDIYFTRISMMKSILTAEFPDVEENLLDKIIDETYDSLF